MISIQAIKLGVHVVLLAQWQWFMLRIQKTLMGITTTTKHKTLQNTCSHAINHLKLQKEAAGQVEDNTTGLVAYRQFHCIGIMNYECIGL